MSFIAGLRANEGLVKRNFYSFLFFLLSLAATTTFAEDISPSTPSSTEPSELGLDSQTSAPAATTSPTAESATPTTPAATSPNVAVPTAPKPVDVSKIFLIPRVGPSEIQGLEWLPQVLPLYDKDGEKGGQLEAVILLGMLKAPGLQLRFGDHTPIPINPDSSFSLQVLLTGERTTNFLSTVDTTGTTQRQFFIVEVPGWVSKQEQEDEVKPTRLTASVFFNKISLDQNDIPSMSEGILSFDVRYILLRDIKVLIPKLNYGIMMDVNVKLDLLPISDPAKVGLKYYQMIGRLNRDGPVWAGGKAQSAFSLGGLIAQSKVQDFRYGLNIFIGPELGFSTRYQMSEKLKITSTLSYTPIVTSLYVNLANSMLDFRVDVEPRKFYKFRNLVFTGRWEHLHFATSDGVNYVTQSRYSLGVGKRF